MERIFETLKRTAAALRRFRRAEEGSYMVYVGIAAIPMVTVAGLGVDIARGYLAESRLQAAIDAAAIAMGSAEGNEDEIKELGRTFFYANFPNSPWAEPKDLTIDVTFTPTGRPESFTISAKAQVDTLFFRLLPYGLSGGGASASTHYDYVDVAASSTALTEVQGLELVMVLDITTSMLATDAGGPGNGRRIEAMRDAALNMVDILFGEQAEPELLRVAIVPYNTVVNIGTNMHTFVHDTGLDAFGNPTTPNPFGQTTWAGCVQTRKDDGDLTDDFDDADTAIGRGLWPAYRWPIEPDRRTSSGSIYNYCETRAHNTTGDYYFYDDPLTTFDTYENDTWQVYNSADPPQLVDSGETRREYDTNTDGPNKGCPSPLLPLTNSRSAVWNYLQSAITTADGNGTATAIGLTWGWHVISPDPPFSKTQEGVDIAAYDNVDWEKAIIVLTDGEQFISSQSSRCDNSKWITQPTALQPPVWDDWNFDPATYNMDGLLLGVAGDEPEQREGPDYRWTAYGYLHPNDSAPLGITAMPTLLEDRLIAVCDAVKAVTDPIAGGPAIQIFTITFGETIVPGDTLSQKMADCTTDPLHNYFHAPNSAKLNEAFEEIARQLTSLRLTD